MSFLAKYRHLSWLLLAIPIFVFLFENLGAFHIRLWDEGWFVVHAYEMLEKGSLLVPYYNGEPVHFGTKPPIQTWLQMISIAVLGYDELSVRLPSAMASAGTVLLVFFWTKKYMSEFTAWVAAITLLTMNGFVHWHTSRGAEADALLTLVIVGQIVFFWEWGITSQRKYLLGLAALVAVSFWVKAVAGFLMLPGMLVYVALYERPWLNTVLRRKETYLYLSAGVAVGISYVFVRELVHPGYIDFMLERQVGRLANDVGHDQPWNYYFNQFRDEHLLYYLPLVFIAQLMPFFMGKNQARPAVFMAVLALVYFLVISAARSKLVWYAMPLYPLYAILVAFPIGKLLADKHFLAQFSFMIIALSIPSYLMFEKTRINRIDEWSRVYEMKEQYLYNMYRRGVNIDGINVVHDHFDGALLFYKYKFKEIAQQVNIQNHLNLKVDDRVLIDSKEFIDELFKRYEADTIDRLETVLLLQITSLKSVDDSLLVVDQKSQTALQ